jgi:fatty acid desaturase
MKLVKLSQSALTGTPSAVAKGMEHDQPEPRRRRSDWDVLSPAVTFWFITLVSIGLWGVLAVVLLAVGGNAWDLAAVAVIMVLSLIALLL